MASEFKGTKGPVKCEQARTILHITGDSPICEISISANHIHEDYRGCKAAYVERQRANASLIAESFNVLHTTGKTPRELAGDVERLERERGELVDALRRLHDESMYWTTQRCHASGDSYGYGTDAEQHALDILAQCTEGQAGGEGQ